MAANYMQKVGGSREEWGPKYLRQRGLDKFLSVTIIVTDVLG